MDYYITIDLLPHPEFKDTIIMNSLFLKLHQTLVALSLNEIGISFPKAKKTLDNQLRLHGTHSALNRLMTEKWLVGFNDYINVSDVTKVPENVKYRVVRRIQAKSSMERLQRRSISKGWLTEKEAVKKITVDKEQRLNLPFINIKSSSSGQHFRLYIKQGALKNESESGRFTSYGLSNHATIPWF